MTVKDILEVTNYIAGINAPGSKPLNLPNFNRMLQAANLAHLKQKIGLPEEYQPGMPLPRQAYNITQVNTEDLRPFKVSLDGKSGDGALIQFTDSLYTLPANYYYFSSLSVNFGTLSANVWKKCTVVTDDTWDRMMGSYVDAPNVDYPIIRFLKDKIQIAPTTAKRGKFTYIRKPSTPLLAMKEVDGFMVYDSTNSVQLEWNETNQFDTLVILLSYLGIAMGKQSVIQYAEMKKAQGV